MSSYKNLDVWKKSMELVKEIYQLVKLFPKEELFAMSSQLKRAAISVPSNIAEGIGRQYKKDTLQFLHISRGSLYEIDTLLSVALTVELISEEAFNRTSNLTIDCLRMLNGFINYYEKAELK